MRKSDWLEEPFNDPLSGERLYPDSWVAKDVGCHPRTVRRWREKHSIVTPGLSEDALARFQEVQALKRSKKRLRDMGKALGLSTAAVRKRIQRGIAAGKTLEAIEATITRNAAKQRRRHGEGLEASVGTLSVEEQIAEWEARLAEAGPGSDEWIAAHDARERLVQRQKDSAT